jgi:hypothetical protein
MLGLGVLLWQSWSTQDGKEYADRGQTSPTSLGE